MSNFAAAKPNPMGVPLGYLFADDRRSHPLVLNHRPLMIVLFLSGMVAVIMMQTLRRDISNYNQQDTVEVALEKTGWKLVSALPCCLRHNMFASHNLWHMKLVASLQARIIVTIIIMFTRASSS